jgi:hypothetical protein
MQKYNRILNAEESFARGVALSVVVNRPLTVWHYMIPFMFIYDFLRRTGVVKRYTEVFMFPRKMAIEAAREMGEGGNKETVLSRVENDIRDWLKSLKLYTAELHRSQMKVVALLIGHYSKLLAADGDSFNDLVRGGYASRGLYEDYLFKLTAAEREVDQALIESTAGNPEIREKIRAEEEQVERIRKNRVTEIYWEMK